VPSKEIEGEELFPPSRSLVHPVIFIAAAIIFIGVPGSVLQQLCQKPKYSL
jgi:hypothetical protein